MKRPNPDNLRTQSIRSLLWQYTLPAIIATMAVALYNVVDRIFIGHGAGALAISGLALCFPIMTLIQAFGTLIGVGSSSRISIVLGMNDKNRAENILGNAIILTILIWAFIALSFLFFLDPLLTFFGGSEQTIPYAKEYLKIIIPGSIFSNLAYSYSSVIRASGSPRKSMQVMLIGVAANIILTPIFIFCFDMGIRGAAWATVISMFISSVFTLSYFMGEKSYIRFKPEKIRIRASTTIDIISIGLSPFLINVAASAVNIIVNQNLSKYGNDLAIGAYGIISSYAILFIMLIIGLCQGMQPIVGYNYGAKLFGRTRRALYLTSIVATIITTVGFILFMSIPEFLARVFTTNEELIGITKEGIRIIYLMFPLVGFQVVIVNFFQSIGRAKSSIFLSLTRQVLFLIPALLICSNIWGLEGVWMAMPIADTLSVIISILLLKMQLNRFRRLELEQI